MAMYIAHNMYMKEANIVEFKNHLSEMIAQVENGEEIEIRRRNLPVAKVIPIRKPGQNKTRLGIGKETVLFLADDLTEPFMEEENWDMLK